MGSAAPTPPTRQRLPSLLELPDSALASVARHLPFNERLRLALVCRGLRRLCGGPSEMWRVVEAVARLPADVDATKTTNEEKQWRREQQLQLLHGFAKWLAPRAAAVEELFFAAVAEEPANPNHYTLLAVPKLLFSCCPADAPLPLAKLSIEWPEAVLLGGPRGALPLPLLAHLRKLALPAVGRLDIGERIPASLALSDFGLCGGTLWGRDAALAAPWLPPSVTALFLESAGLRALPTVLAHLPRLRSLVLGHNRLSSASLDPLSSLASLQELNISECYLNAFPSQVSALTGLRILYLHNAFNRNAAVPPGAWDALRPLARLAFLSLSGNGLQAVPPAVAAMSRLQGLHIEDNELCGGLPLAPLLAGLRELLLDWQAALESGAALRAATRLSRLALVNHRALEEGPGPGLTVRSAEAAEPLLAALAAMPALRRVDDVFGEEDSVTAPVAAAMWQLGRRCPRVQLRMLCSTDIGWGLAELERRRAAGELD